MQNLALEVGLILVIPAVLALNILALPIISTFLNAVLLVKMKVRQFRALGFYALGLPSYALVKVMEPRFARGDT